MSLPPTLVIVPTYNERANLMTLVTGLLVHENVRVLVVDDQSPDGTGQLADDLARHAIGKPAIVVIGEIVRMRPRLLALLPELAEECLSLQPL